MPIATGKLAYVLLLIPGGILVDYFGPRLMVLLGISGLAIIMIFYAIFATTFSTLLICHVLMATVAAVSGIPVYSIFVAQWFHSSIGLAMGLVLSGYSAAGTFVPAVLGPVADHYGWRVAMGCMVAVLVLVGLPATYIFLHERQDPSLVPSSPSSLTTVTAPQSEGITTTTSGNNTPKVRPSGDDVPEIRPPGDDGPEVRPLLSAEQGISVVPLADVKSWTFVGFALSYMLLQYCNGCFSENIMFFLTLDRKMSLGVASMFFSTINLSAFSAKVVGGHLGDRFDRFHVASASSGIATIGILFLFIGSDGLDNNHLPRLTNHSAMMVIFALLFGFGYGATFNCLYALTSIVFGKRNLGRTQSTLFGLGLAGNAVGSVVTAVLRAQYGSYQRSFLVALMACGANFFVFNANRRTLGGKRARGKRETEGTNCEGGVEHQDGGIMATGQARVAVEIEDRDEGKAGGCDGDGWAAGPSGMVQDGGFPRPRDWSSVRLQQGSSGEEGTRSRTAGTLRKSSTVEALIESGIMSATMEDVGDLGQSGGRSGGGGGREVSSQHEGCGAK